MSTTKELKIGLITHLFPSKRDPHRGKYMLDQYKAIQAIPDLKLRLLVPTPRAILGTQKWKTNNSALHEVAPDDERVKYISLPRRIKPLVIQKNISRALLQKLNLEKPDLLHIHWLYPDALAIPALKQAGYPIVLTIHGSDWYKSLAYPNLKPLLYEALKQADYILCSGPKLKTDILVEMPCIEHKIEVIYNYIDTQFYTVPSAFESLRAINQLEWKGEHTHALCVANIRHEKGIDVLIDALNHLNKGAIINDSNNINLLFVHVIGIIESGEYADSIKKRLNEDTSIPMKIYTPVSPDELKLFYHASDFFILPSRSEGFNVSLIEASSCGLPIVATKVGGNHLIIRTKKFGELVKPDNAKSLANKIQNLMTKIDKYKPDYIRNETVKDYDLSILTKKLKRIYTDVLRVNSK